MWISLEGECYNQWADNRGGGWSPKNFCRSLGPHHLSKNKGGRAPQAPPLDPPRLVEMFRDSDKEMAFFHLKSLLVTHLRDKAFTPLSLPYKVVPLSRIAPSSDPAKKARLYFSKKRRDSGT